MKSTIKMAVSKTKYSIEVMGKIYEEAPTEKVTPSKCVELNLVENVRSDAKCS